MSRKVAVITGATGGIGKVVCKYLVTNGYTVFAACRDSRKGEMLRNEIFGNSSDTSSKCNPIAGTPSACNLVFVPLDLKSFASVQEFCATIIEHINSLGCSISLLINNAGVISPVYEVTQDEYESTMQVNYLSGKKITETLLPHINGKIINTVSCTINTGSYKEPEKEEFKESRKENTFTSLKIYSNSKLMLALYTIELHKRLQKGISINGKIKDSNNIQVYGIDPGIVNTGIITMHRWYDPLANIFFRPFIKTAEQGAIPLIRAIEYNQSSGLLLFIGNRTKQFPSKLLRMEKEACRK